jgi:hypothetical protein
MKKPQPCAGSAHRGRGLHALASMHLLYIPLSTRLARAEYIQHRIMGLENGVIGEYCCAVVVLAMHV